MHMRHRHHTSECLRKVEDAAAPLHTLASFEVIDQVFSRV